jgi:hypothetical protein
MDTETRRRKPKAQLRRKRNLLLSRTTKAKSAHPLKVAVTLKKLPASLTKERVLAILLRRASGIIGYKDEALRWMGLPVGTLILPHRFLC